MVKSTDRGRSWTNITGNLPAKHNVWTVAQDHVNGDLLFAGTEFGLFFTADGAGDTFRRCELDSEPGLQRFAWNLVGAGMWASMLAPRDWLLPPGLPGFGVEFFPGPSLHPHGLRG